MSFVVLPDSEAASGVAGLVCTPPGTQVVAHASGRPWIAGRWPAGGVRVAEAGQARVAVAGFCPVTAAELDTAAARLRRVEDLATAAAGWGGSAHLLASVGGRTRVQGTASGVRAVFHARVDGLTVASDLPDTLAELTGAGVDEEILALRLLIFVPYPLRYRSVWRDVHQVPAGWYLLTERDGAARTVRWWTPPEPEVPLAEGAAAVREALTAAVSARVQAAGPVVSTDLSGGLDSGTITCLAARAAAGLVTMHLPQRDGDSEDARWTARIARELPAAEHLTPDYDQMPTMFAGLDGTTRMALACEPPILVRGGAQLIDAARRTASRGSRLHLTGHGGDEVFHSAPTVLHTLIRSRPVLGARLLRERRALGHWPLWSSVRALADSRSLPSGLVSAAARLRDPDPSPSVPRLGWTLALRMPAWATDDAVAVVRDLLTRAARDRPEPLGPGRAGHIAVEAIQNGGSAMRYMAALMAEHGMDYAAPCLDDTVIDAALAVRLDQRAAPGRFKPLLAEAMRGLVPEDLLGRATKGEYSEDIFDGIGRHRATLLELFDDSLLARRGLINPAIARGAIRTDHTFIQPLMALEPTLGCEVWLRVLPEHRPLSTAGVP